MQKRYRFIGIRPFEENEKDLFFERAESVEIILNSLKTNKTTLVHSTAGVGKTSIIKAGVLPILHKQINSKVIYISFSNFIKNAGINPLNQIYAELEDYLPNVSYLDKIIEPENSLWYKLKRIENAQEEPIYLILDQFENVFTHEQTFTYQLRSEIFSALYESIPKNLKKSIEQKLQEDSSLLTDKGFEKLFSAINVNILISIRSDKVEKLNFFVDKIKILENVYEIPQLTVIKAIEILSKTANFVPKYSIDNLFESKPFVLSESLINRISVFLSRENQTTVETYQLQIIGKELEKISINKNINIISAEHIGKIEDIFEDYYDAIVKNISDPTQQTGAKKFIEDELIFEYEHRKLTIYQGIALKKYGLTNNTLNYLTNNHLITQIHEKSGEIFYELSHDALITPILIAKQKRIKYEISIQEQLKEKEILEQKNKIQTEKIKLSKRYNLFLGVLLVFAIILAFLAVNKTIIANKNKRIAQSNLFAAYSFNTSEKDGTLSFRLAQMAYNTDNSNYLAISSLLNSFYNAKYFYYIEDTLNSNFQYANISGDNENVIFTDNFGKSKSITILNLKSKISKTLEFEKSICQANFIDSLKYFITTSIDGKTTIYNKKNKEVVSFTHQCPVHFVNKSVDNSLILTCGADNNVKLWNTKGNLVSTFIHSAFVNFATISDDNQYVVTTTDNNQVIVWTSNAQKINTYSYELEFDKQWVNISYADVNTKKQNVLFVVNSYTSNSYQIKVWNFKTNKIVAEFKGIDSWVNGAFFVDTATIFAYTKNGTLYSLNIQNQQIFKHKGHTNEIISAFFDSKNQVITSFSTDKTIRKWKIYSPFHLLQNYNDASKIKFSNGGSLIAILNKKINVTDLLGKLIFTSDLQFEPQNIDFTTDDSYVIVNNEHFVCWSNIVTKAKTSIKLFDTILFAGITGDNSKIVVSTPFNVYTYNFRGQKIGTFHLESISSAFSIVYNKIYTSNNKQILVYTTSGKKIDSLNIQNVSKIFNTKGDNYKFLFVAGNKAYIVDKNHHIKSEISLNQIINIAKISINGDFIALATSDECFLFNSNGKKIISFSNLFKIIDIEFSSNQKTLFVLSKNANNISSFSTFVISPAEIIKYVDELKLYGNVQVFDNLFIDKLLKNQIYN